MQTYQSLTREQICQREGEDAKHPGEGKRESELGVGRLPRIYFSGYTASTEGQLCRHGGVGEGKETIPPIRVSLCIPVRTCMYEKLHRQTCSHHDHCHPAGAAYDTGKQTTPGPGNPGEGGQAAASTAPDPAPLGAVARSGPELQPRNALPLRVSASPSEYLWRVCRRRQKCPATSERRRERPITED